MANKANILNYFTDEARAVPVNDLRDKDSLYEEYPREQVDFAFHAWNLLGHALQKDDDKKERGLRGTQWDGRPVENGTGL